MRIKFERGGGFLPTATRLSYTIDSADLPPTAANELQALVAEAKDAAPSSPAANSRPRPDVFYYRVSIEDETGSHTIEASDNDMPTTFRPLIDWLIKRAT